MATTVAVASILASAGALGYSAYEGKKQRKEARKAAEAAEAAANAGQTVETPEAAATEDTAGNEAYKRRQAALAAGYRQGRGGTSITSNLGGGGTLG